MGGKAAARLEWKAKGGTNGVWQVIPSTRFVCTYVCMPGSCSPLLPLILHSLVCVQLVCRHVTVFRVEFWFLVCMHV